MSSTIRIGIVADDLTGACDAAVHFADAMLTAYVALYLTDPPPTAYNSWALNTDSRNSRPGEAAARTRQALECMQQSQAARIIKKIDSLMRGNIGVEIQTAVDVLRPSITVLTPAFPTLGRTVQDGYLHVHGAPRPVRVSDLLPGLRCAAFKTDRHGDPATRFAWAIDSKTDVLIADASTNDDLRLVVEAAKGIENIFWVRSGGLAHAIAKTMGCGAQKTYRPPKRSTAKPFLICAGSDHKITIAQLRHLEARNLAVFFDAGAEEFTKINTFLRNKHNVALRIPRVRQNAKVLKSFADSIEVDLCGGLVLTGGDTALQILNVLEARGIRVYTEILPGMPQGKIVGGAPTAFLC